MVDESGKYDCIRHEKCKVVIVVPLYTSRLTLSENISLMQLYRILGKYPICYVMPERMRSEFTGSAIWTEYFPDEFFKNVQSYSRLCLESMFYARFSAFEYMLIYQPDAFVFRDELDAWCAKGYDYIGAPWPWLFLKEVPRAGIHWRRIGNGGFSLRRIQTMLWVLEQKHEILISYPKPEILLDGEDLFWAYYASLSGSCMRVPNEREAQMFSLEGGGEHYLQNMTEKKLPFGCHGWSRPDYGYLFSPWIERFGYRLVKKNPAIVHVTWHEKRRYVLETNVLRRWQRYHQERVPELILRFWGYLPNNIALWGNGKYGKLVLEIISVAGVSISCMYDKKAEKGDQLKGVDVLQPHPEKRTMHMPIFISTLKYECEIDKELVMAGYIKNKDFFLLSDFLHASFREWPVLHNIKINEYQASNV